ncbi:uncharacterized protein KY384_009258 [Bacidia gigantensis]|uniref:uncharacterized protein n=1 Tax=Bacidia gigantensis TaxID=2732470 RepID=UPI001D03D43A|nr:uncharacterized protein KY384_009258 [Bacidia gigantensis]KAG8525614.1 hypothetical protein KY384_009258 [Bacidia gigantensis]
MLHEKVLSRKIVGANLDEKDSKDSKDSKPQSDQPASTGKILNLMKSDAYEIAQRFWEIQTFLDVPIGLVLSMVLVWKLVGWTSILGIAITIVAQGVTALIMRYQLKLERIRRAATDTRLQKTSQFIEAIRHLRWYAWQDFWLDQILTQRQNELRKRVIADICDVSITLTQSLAGNMFPVAVFYAYTTWAGQPLRVDVVFPALQVFGMVQRSLGAVPRLVNVLLRARISMQRIEAFMKEPNKDEHDEKTAGSDTPHHLHIDSASFAWPGKDDNVLHDIDLQFVDGLTVIFGEVASGKSALLQSILGELDLRSGHIDRSSNVFGYCAQSPWLQSMSIRDNILFSLPFDEERYYQVLDACALTIDLEHFKDGDRSLIGENGIGLSGGQRARVALARAVYSRAPTLLLDDPLSALDHQTAEHVVKKCLKGPLTNDRTVILVTHRVELCQPHAKQMVEVTDGKASALTYKPSPELLTKVKTQESVIQDTVTDKKDATDEKAEKFIGDEERAHGGVKYKVYWQYIKAGKLRYWAFIIFLLAIGRVLSISQDYFLKEWAEAYDRPSVTQSSIVSDFFDKFPSPEVKLSPWLWCFFGLAAARSLMWVLRDGGMVVIVYVAGKGMFKKVMQRVANATFRFYDITPVGRLMNRMTSDIGTMDGGLTERFSYIALFILSWISSIIVIASVTPVFLVFSCALVAGFVYVFLRFLPTSQSLRRLEMVSLSPLMSNFGNLIHGLTTVRAFCVQKRFQDQVIDVTDDFQKMDHFYWSLQAWLSCRFDYMSAFSTFILTMLAIYTGVSPGLTAFTLIAASNFVNATHALCRMYGSLQMQFVSVERIVELFDLEQETPGSIDPPASWPKLGSEISFKSATLKYAPHFDPALHDLSFTIPGGSTTALLGRTGSGKSTLALSLLATIVPTTGSITIDGIDVSKVNKQVLRHRITFLAQDPVLFPGSMRENLDPLSEHTDGDCDGVLQRVCGKHGWNLDTRIDSGGSNLSQGQRQLVGLTRAVLRRSPIIILDEATASIDTETALSIQQILREEMRESTVITIAHRLEAVKNADFFIRLDHGRIIEQGHVEADAFDDSRDLGLK